MAKTENKWDFGIQDKSGDEIGRITRTSPGLAREISTKAALRCGDSPAMDEPLRCGGWLAIAGALAVDTSLRQR